MLIVFGNANSRKKYIPLNTGQIRSQPVATYYSPYLHFLCFCFQRSLAFLRFDGYTIFICITAANFPKRRRKPFGIKRRQSCYYFEFWLSAVFIKKIQKTGFGTTEKSGERGKIFGRICKDLPVLLHAFLAFCEDLNLLNLSQETGRGIAIQHDRPTSEASGKDGGEEN